MSEPDKPKCQHPAELDTMREAIEWVLNDAAFKAPEQIGDVPSRWLARLQGALSNEHNVALAALDPKDTCPRCHSRKRDVFLFYDADRGLICRAGAHHHWHDESERRTA